MREVREIFGKSVGWGGYRLGVGCFEGKPSLSLAMDKSVDELKRDAKAGKLTAEQIAQDLKNVIREAQELIKDTGQKQFAAKAEAASRSIHEGADHLRQTYQDNLELAEEAIDYSRAQVKERPLAAVGIAMGVGALLALTFCRRH